MSAYWSVPHPPQDLFDFWPTILALVIMLNFRNPKASAWRQTLGFWPVMATLIAQYGAHALASYVLIIVAFISWHGWRPSMLTWAPPLGFIYGAFRLYCGFAWLLAAFIVAGYPCRMGCTALCQHHSAQAVIRRHGR